MSRLCVIGSTVVAVGLLGILGLALAMPVTPTRGRDEIDFAHLSNVALEPGGQYDQPVQLQAADLTSVEFPYRLLGTAPATVQVEIRSSSGVGLATRALSLPPTAAGASLIPGLSASFWDGEQARIATMDTSPPPAGDSMITVHLQRLDRGAQPVILFVEDPAAALTKPSLTQMPRVAIVFLTGYGSAEPVFAKIPLYATRLGETGYQWPGFAFVGLALLSVLACLAVIVAIALAPDKEAGRQREGGVNTVERP